MLNKKKLSHRLLVLTLLIVGSGFWLCCVGRLDREAKEIESREELLGILKELGSKHGFDVALQVDNGSGPYIVHIPQIHRSEKEHRNFLFADIIIRSQKKIECIIPVVQSTGYCDRIVYFEGLTEERTEELIRLVKNQKKEWDEFAITAFSYQAAAELFDEHALKVPGKDKFGETIFIYLLSKKIQSMEKYFRENPPMLDPEKKRVTQAEATIKEARMWANSNVFSIASDNYVYIRPGLPFKLLIDGDIIPKGAETKETIIPEDAVDLDQRTIFKDREDAAIRIISAQARTSSDRLFLMVYGHAHNFSDSVREHNKNNPNHKLGLIRVMFQDSK